MSEYHGLSEAERAALEDEDLDNEGTLDPADEGADDDEGESADKPNETPTGDDDTGNQDDAGDAGDDTAEASASESPQSFAVPAADINQIDQALKELTDKREALESQYEAGDSETTYAEHRAQVREIDQAIQDLNLEKAEARVIQKMNQAYQLEWWTREVNAFKREALKDGIDYDKDEKLGAEWDRAVQFLGQDPGNANQDAKWFLQEAHEMVKARFRIPSTKTDAAPKPSRVDEALASRRRKQGELPPSLAKIPEAGANDEREGEFSHLESLSGAALERALAKLTPDQAERFLSS